MYRERGIIMRRNKAAFLWMCLAIVAAIVSISHAVSKETNKITCTGKIVDAEAKPLIGAKVALYVNSRGLNSFSYGISPTEQVTSASDGSFFFSVLADSDNYINGYVVAEKEGLALGWSKWDMRKGSVELEIKLTVPNALAGVVVDENDKPVPAARVSISYLHINKQYLPRPFAPSLLSTDTDADGKFTFTNLPLGMTADFTVEKTGFATIGTTSSQLRHTVEQRDIKFVLPVEARIEGIVVEKKTGKPAAGIRLIVKQRNSWVQDAFNSKDDGTFSVDSLTSGKYKLEIFPPEAELADWIAEPVEILAEKGKATSGVRIELVKGGVLEVVVTDAISGKPVENAGVTVLNNVGGQSGYGLSGKDGIARFRLIPGDYYLFGTYRQGYSPINSEDLVVIENGKTERWEYALFPESKITGIVQDENGRPLEGVKLIVWPTESKENAVTDAGGKFEITYNIPSFPGPAIDKPEFLVLCRYEEGNLAATINISEDTRVLDVKLKPGVNFTGNVMDPDGKGIEGAKIYVDMLRPGWNWSIGPERREQTTTDKEGKFEIIAIPAGNKYDLSVKAEGYGIKIIEQIDTDHLANNQLDMGNVTLAVANLSISGMVVDENDKPVAGAVVNNSGINQPHRNTKTDSNGKFTLERVCAGRIRIGVVKFGATTLLGSVDTDVGATDIKIVISEKSSHRYLLKQPASLVGKHLPELKDLQIELPPSDLDNKKVLVCFWDMNQRPSRNCLMELAGRAKELENKGVIIAAVQASKVDGKTLAGWKNEHDISLTIGMVLGDVEKTKSVWNVRSLPWLILTDKQHVVRAEGFALAELGEKLKANK